jgi:hypothetical protein
MTLTHCCPTYSLSLRDADMDVGSRAPTVGALGDAWSSCREGWGEGIICLYCCSWYSCPYIVQHHKTTEAVAYNVHSYYLVGQQ